MDLARLKTPAPEPKERCSRCQRPLAILKTGVCIYCGEKTGGGQAQELAEAALPPEVLLALVPRERDSTSGRRWTVRLIAIGATLAFLAYMAGPCMRE